MNGPPAELARILSVARRRNAVQGITGTLLCSGERFAQVLEGPRDAVEATFARILRDPRHRYTTVLEAAEVGERAFARWSMALAGPASGQSMPLKRNWRWNASSPTRSPAVRG